MENKNTKKDIVVKDGVVLEKLPGATFKIEIEDFDHEVLAHVAGKLRRYYIKLVPGDKVRVEFSKYDLTRGRIVYRYAK
ncbi:MAG TPA: translation initiation factor IF-1 [candidate division WWE3 bacterium]|uniref:Translation initiation factor IF-1 n=1 Tax=candidate division WWE3 bacterium TaxID=2053526 RepID=A0A7V5MH39_UNCKA|nr:translation initiation factor IF-1 [candidate division WWE3 bacterium]